MERCESIVRAYNIPIYQRPGLEADDLIASVVDRALTAGLRVVIVSADKDLMQLVRDDDDRVVLWDSMRDKVYGADEVRAKFGVAPSKLRDLLALTGDTSDNVPGVPSVGPKTASDLLLTYESIDGIYRQIDSIKKAKLKEALVTHEADARLSQKLVTLTRDVPIELDVKKLVYGGADPVELRRLFTELEFTRLLEQLKPTTTMVRAYNCVTDAKALDAVLETAQRTSRAWRSRCSGRAPDPMRGEVIGISLATSVGRGDYVPHRAPLPRLPAQLRWPDVVRELGSDARRRKVKKVAHDLKTIEVLFHRYRAADRRPNLRHAPRELPPRPGVAEHV